MGAKLLLISAALVIAKAPLQSIVSLQETMNFSWNPVLSSLEPAWIFSNIYFTCSELASSKQCL